MTAVDQEPSASPEPLVSIITPAYRAARFVAATIESVQRQDYRNWEMLVVDDGSPDDTAAIVAFYESKDPRIRLIKQANAGPAAARQAALDQCRSDLVAFLDSDDLWLPEKLSRQVAFMRQRRAAVSFTRFRRIDADNTMCGREIPVPVRLDYAGLLRNTALATSTVMVDRALTGSFRLKHTYYDDFALWLDLLKRGHVAHGLQEDLMRYRVVNTSVSRNKIKSARMVWRTYRDIEQLSPAHATWCFVGYAVNALRKYRSF